MFDRVELILKHLEALIRGGSRNRDEEMDKEVLQHAVHVFDWATSSSSFEEASRMSDETRGVHSGTAVKVKYHLYPVMYNLNIL